MRTQVSDIPAGPARPAQPPQLWSPAEDCPFPDRVSAHGPAAEDYARTIAAECAIPLPVLDKLLSKLSLGLAVSQTFPDADLAGSRLGALWILFLVLSDDAWSDDIDVTGDWLSEVSDIHRAVEPALAGAEPGPGADPLVRLLARIPIEMRSLRSGRSVDGFQREFRRYLASTLWELDMRSRGSVPTLAVYLKMRRLFSTMGAQLEVNQFVCDLAITRAERSHPIVELAELIVADYSCLCNDFYSLGRESRAGLTSNVFVVLQRDQRQSSDQTTAQLRGLMAGYLASYVETRAQAVRLTELSTDILQPYFDHLEAFMAAAAHWHSQSERYHALPTVGR